jgi:membrane protease YdiL (CAAX protease family)
MAMIAVSSGPHAAGGAWRPLLLAALVVAAVLATAVPASLGATVDAGYAVASKAALCALAVVLLSSLHLWGRAGFLALPTRRDLRVLALPSLLVAGMLVAVVVAGPAEMDASQVIAFAVVAAAVGFSEEALFRGVLLESLRPWGPLAAMLATTVAFALLHIAGLMGGASLDATLAQVLIGGLPFGLAFAGLRLTTASIWPLVVIHATNNLASFLMSGHWEAVTQDTSRYGAASVLGLALIVALAAYGVWFLWRFSRGGRGGDGD